MVRLLHLLLPYNNYTPTEAVLHVLPGKQVLYNVDEISSRRVTEIYHVVFAF